MKIRKQAFFTGALILLLGTLSLVYWAGKKEVWFCDEIYTYESANGFEQDWPSNLKDIWQTGEDVESYFAADWNILSLNDITTRLYNDHVPLYFWIFRAVSVWAFHGSGTIWIGMSINLFFYLIVLGVVYRMFWSLTGSPWAAGIISLLTGVVNRLMIEQATTLRMYMMLLLAMVVLLLAEFGLLRAYDDGRKPWKEAAFLFLASTLGFLTHYDYWIFFAVTAALTCLWLLFLAFRKGGRAFWHTREFGFVLVSVCCFALSLAVTIVVFPYCRWNLNTGKAKIALSSLFIISGEKAEHILWGYQRLSVSMFGNIVPVWLGLFVIAACIFGGGMILCQKKEFRKLRNYVMSVLIAQFYQLIVCFTLPDAEEEHYLWGCFMIMMWCMAYGAWLLLEKCFAAVRKVKYGNMISCAAAVLLTACVFFGEISVIDDGNGVAYLFYPGKDRSLLEEYAQIPWIVYGPTVGVYSYYDWIIPDEICFLSEDQTQADAQAVLEKAEEESFLLYVYVDYLQEAVEFLEQTLGREVEVEYLMQSTNLSVYVLRVAD
ncbi:MAG: hypothetical protein LUI10_00365 [Lachnospiraceae bacterium]|nr:hypothetical protein [Lachnospiraceae bacterium]